MVAVDHKTSTYANPLVDACAQLVPKPATTPPQEPWSFVTR